MPHTDTDLPNCPHCPSVYDQDERAAWCRDHAQRIHDALLGLPAAYRTLATTEELDTGHKEILRAPSPEPTSPSRRMDYADVILRDLCRWEDALRTHLHHLGARHEASHTTHALDAAVAYLTRWHTAALNAPGALDYGQEILALARTAHRLLGTGDTPLRPARQRLHGLCTGCGQLTLYRIDGTDRVACTTCPTEISHDHYQQTVTWLLHAYGQPVAA